MVSTRICHNQEAGLPESSLDLIGECTRGETTMEGSGTSGRGELQHCSLKQTVQVLLEIATEIITYRFFLKRTVAQVTIKPHSWDSCPYGVSESRPDYSCTLPTPEHQRKCQVLTVCT